jgi:hypothetical protein
MSGFKFKSQKKTGKRSGVHQQVKDGLEIPVNRQVYMVWYAYAQYLKKNGLVIKRNKPRLKKKNFGKLDKKVSQDWKLPVLKSKRKIRNPADEYIDGFDDWFEKNWKELFAEKEIGFVQPVNTIPKNPDENKIYIEVPLDTDSYKLSGKCKEIIDAEMKTRKIPVNTKPISTAKYKPDVPPNYNYRVLIRQLCAKHLHDTGHTNTEIFEYLFHCTIGSEVRGSESMYEPRKYDLADSHNQLHGHSWRVVAKDYENAEVLLKDVKSGLFCTRDFPERRKSKVLFSDDTSTDYFRKKKRKKKIKKK